MKIKVVGSHLCEYTKDSIKILKEKNIDIEFINISKTLESLKEYLNLRDTEEIYKIVKINGRIGIPCFIFPNGLKTLNLDEVLEKL